MRPLSPTLSKLPVIVCGSPSSPLVTNCTSTVSSIQSLSFTMPPSVLFSTRLSSSKHPTPQGSGLRRILHPNFRESPNGEVRRIHIPRTPVNTEKQQQPAYSEGEVCHRRGERSGSHTCGALNATIGLGRGYCSLGTTLKKATPTTSAGK